MELNRKIPKEAINALIDEAGITSQRGLIRRLIRDSLGLGQDGASRLDLKITAAAVEEMRSAFRLFAPYKDVPKVSIFGSARTLRPDPLWETAEGVSRRLAERGWMAVTGAGPGIMEAAATGAGREMSLGVSIRLPFEEAPNAVVTHDDHHVAMRYFFTRKLMLVKESRGFVCLPGGFGTMDETFELLTLQQTGKAEPVPIVLLDTGSGFWGGLRRFVEEYLVPTGVVSPDDFDRVLVTDSVDAAVAEITGFWRNYRSLRWVGDLLVLRLRYEPTDADMRALNHEFGDMCAEGRIERIDPLPEERSDADQVDAPRIALHLRQHAVGDLYKLIRAINHLPSAR